LLDSLVLLAEKVAFFSFVLGVCPEEVWQDAAMTSVMVAAWERTDKVILV